VSRTDEELIRDALEHIEILNQHLTQGTMDEPIIADAVCMRLAASIESISQTSVEFREHYFVEQWHLMKATRNLISHGYSFVDPTVIRDTVEKDLPGVEVKLRSALEQF
jgi:uncharacterized protein with HEPN domain